MNAEQLGLQNNSFKTVLIFFLLHEMPPQNTGRNAARTRPGWKTGHYRIRRTTAFTLDLPFLVIAKTAV